MKKLISLFAGLGCIAAYAQTESIFTRCADQIENIYAACDYMRNSSSDAGCYDRFGAKNFALMMTSDLHEDNVRLANSIELLNGCDAIDAAVFTGDFQYWRCEPGYSEKFISLINGARKPYLVAFGNHDIHLWRKEYDRDLPVTTAAKQFMLLSNEASCYRPRGYGYKDFPDYGIRLIILNPCDFPEDKGPDGYVFHGANIMYQQEQIDWLLATLGSVPESYTVIIASHLCEPMVPDETALKSHDEAANVKFNLPLGNCGYMSGTVISDIVDAWKHRKKISAFYSFSTPMQDGTKGVKVKADFSAAAGDFACYIHGHYHHDLIGHNSAHPDQTVYLNDASACPRVVNDGTSVSQYSLYPRNAKGRSQDLITVLCIDKFNRRLNFVRVGADTNIFLEKTGLLSYPY